MAVERLHKVMANAGIASRRECEAMIAAGRVSVNGQVVTEMGVKVDPERDQIRVDGEPLKPRARSKSVYLMLYKPAGYLSVFDDERGRPGLEALVPSGTRLYPVGRLDADSEGLQLLTNDGELTLRLSHPRYEHAKTYLVLVDHSPSAETLARFRRGIELEDGKTLPSDWRILHKPPAVAPPSDSSQTQGVWLQVTLREGRKRQIRRMAAAEKLSVRRLIRIGMGPLRLDRKLRPGQSRPLTGDELRLLNSSGADPGSRAPRRPAGDRPAAPGRAPAPRRGADTDRTRPPASRGAATDRTRPPAGRGAETERRSRPEGTEGAGRPQPSSERPTGPSRGTAAERESGAGRRRAAPGRDGRYDRAQPGGQSGRSRATAGRGGGAGRRPPYARGSETDRRSRDESEPAPGRRRGPAAPGGSSGPAQSGGSRQGPSSSRTQRPGRSERPGEAAQSAGRPARRQSPLRFQRPPKQGGRAGAGGPESQARGGRPRSETQRTGSTGRRPQGGQSAPRSGGSPKKRKP